MGKFYCSSCNKEIKTIMHKCWFQDRLTCKVYDPCNKTSPVDKNEFDFNEI